MLFQIFILTLFALAQSTSCPFGYKSSKSPSNCTFDHLSVDPDPETTTVEGCTCTSACGATLDFGNANCDWCYTANKCGSYSYSRFAYYDYCVYPQQSDDKTMDYVSKTNAIWSKIIADRTPGSYPNILGLLSESIQTSFDDQWDVMPAGRTKYIHSVGAVCQVDFVINQDKYTGILKQGKASGFIRMGSAGEVQTSGSGITPGNGFKFMRTGRKSANFVSLYSLNGQTGFNFFKNNQSNHIAAPTGALAVLGQKFAQASNCVSMVGLSDLCMYDQSGAKTNSLKFPFKLTFVPSPAVKSIMPDTALSQEQILKYMSSIKTGTPLYEIVAQDTPLSADFVLGVVVTTSECTASKFGDSKFFIRHQRMEEDFEIHPEWMTQIDAVKECGYSDISPNPPRKCTEPTTVKEVI